MPRHRARRLLSPEGERKKGVMEEEAKPFKVARIIVTAFEKGEDGETLAKHLQEFYLGVIRWANQYVSVATTRNYDRCLNMSEDLNLRLCTGCLCLLDGVSGHGFRENHQDYWMKNFWPSAT